MENWFLWEMEMDIFFIGYNVSCSGNGICRCEVSLLGEKDVDN